MSDEYIGKGLKSVKVRCYNAPDCKSKLVVHVEEGARVPKKLCWRCKEFGQPKERGLSGVPYEEHSLKIEVEE